MPLHASVQQGLCQGGQGPVLVGGDGEMSGGLVLRNSLVYGPSGHIQYISNLHSRKSFRGWVGVRREVGVVEGGEGAPVRMFSSINSTHCQPAQVAEHLHEGDEGWGDTLSSCKVSCLWGVGVVKGGGDGVTNEQVLLVHAVAAIPRNGGKGEGYNREHDGGKETVIEGTGRGGGGGYVGVTCHDAVLQASKKIGAMLKVQHNAGCCWPDRSCKFPACMCLRCQHAMRDSNGWKYHIEHQAGRIVQATIGCTGSARALDCL